jgi:hypothetical protein
VALRPDVSADELHHERQHGRRARKWTGQLMVSAIASLKSGSSSTMN